MEIFSNVIEITASLFEVFVILLFINRFLNLKYLKKHFKIQFVVSFIIIGMYMVISQYLQNYVFEKYTGIFDIIGILLFIIYTVVLFDAKILYKILVPTLSISFIMIANSAMVMLFTNVFGISGKELFTVLGLPRIIVMFSGKILYLILSEMILKFYRRKKTYLSKPETVFICGAVICSLVLMFELMKEMLMESEKDISMYILLLTSTILIDIFMFFALKLISDKNRKTFQYQMEKMKNDNIVNLYNSTKTIYNELQMMRHDMKNRMLILYDYIEKDEKEKAFAFIDDMVESKLKNFVTYINTGSDIIDTVINIKLNIAREHNIDVECNICSDFETNDNENIVAVISNAIDNAIEASEKVKNPHITLSIVDKRKYTDVTVSNLIEESVLKKNEALETSKKEKNLHGFGINSMKKICNECNGMLEFYEILDSFVIHIMFPKK